MSTNNYVLARGKIYIDLFDANGNLTGERYFGNTPGAVLAITSTNHEHYSAETPLDELDDEATGQISRKFNITADNIDDDNLAAYIAGAVAAITQASGTATNHVLGPVAADRYYQIGVSASNPTGERGVTVSAVNAKEGDAASGWTTGATQAVGDFIVPTVANDHFYMAEASTAATAATEPTWPTDGSTVVDGGVTWRDMGLIAYTVTTDYTADATLGRLYVVSTGVIATAVALAEAAGVSISLNVDYSRAANSRNQVATSNEAKVTAAIRYVADNKRGSNRDMYIPKANMRPTGNMPWKGDNYQTMELEVTALRKDSTTEAIYIDGRAA